VFFVIPLCALCPKQRPMQENRSRSTPGITKNTKVDDIGKTAIKFE